MYGEKGLNLKRSEPLLDKAERFIRSAQLLAADGDKDFLALARLRLIDAGM